MIDEPKIDEIRTGRDLGFSKVFNKYQWSKCPDCDYVRWVRLDSLNHRCRRCGSLKNRCKGKGHGMWKGGRIKSGEGYISVWVSYDNPFYSMADHYKYIAEHRLVMAQSLGRCLTKDEIVHHKNGIKTDNRIENLELTKNGQHCKDHHKGYQDGFEKGYKDGLDKQVQKLKEQIRLLEVKLNG
jgi:hypothetical protein